MDIILSACIDDTSSGGKYQYPESAKVHQVLIFEFNLVNIARQIGCHYHHHSAYSTLKPIICCGRWCALCCGAATLAGGVSRRRRARRRCPTRTPSRRTWRPPIDMSCHPSLPTYSTTDPGTCIFHNHLKKRIIPSLLLKESLLCPSVFKQLN